MIKNSFIYTGNVVHKRFKPKVHYFKYKVFSLLLDLSEVHLLNKSLKVFFDKTNCKLMSINQNLIDELNIKKINKKPENFYILPKQAIDQNYKLKINKLINILNKKKIDFQFISSNENVAWLLNIRGKESKFTPIPNAYLSIDIDKRIYLFCDLNKVPKCGCAEMTLLVPLTSVSPI